MTSTLDRHNREMARIHAWERRDIIRHNLGVASAASLFALFLAAGIFLTTAVPG